VSRSGSPRPEALSSVHAVGAEGRLLGVARLITLLQADPAADLADACYTDPVRIAADTDVMDVAVLMTRLQPNHDLVVDRDCRMLGVITVDDVLEVTLPGRLAPP
jgi:Mg/Co/Ni transporter MgtE